MMKGSYHLCDITRFWVCFFVLWLTLQGYSVQAKASDTTTCSCTASSEILREGLVTADEKTSRAVDEILKRCAEAYKTMERFSGRGSHLGQIKLDESRQLVREQRFEIAFERPNRLSVIFRLPSGAATSQFTANGKEVLMVWEPQMRLFGALPDNVVYRVFPQPPSLSVFVDGDATADLYDDESGCLVASIAAPLLASSDPLAWLHANVVEYYYDGCEQVAGHCCYRIRFHQTNPEVAITQWIDSENYLIRKLSVVHARSALDTPSWSMSTAAVGEMWVTTFDDISTGPLSAPSSFSTVPPAKAKKAQTGLAEAQSPANNVSMPFFQRFLRAAITSSQRETSITLKQQDPAHRWEVGKVWTFDSAIAGLSSGRPDFIVFPTKDGKIWWMDACGLRELPHPTAIQPDIVVPFRAPHEWDLLLARQERSLLSLVNLRGEKIWDHEFPSEILSITVDDQQTSHPLIYVGLKSGLAVLSPEGKTLYATRKARYIREILVTEHSIYGPVLLTVSGEQAPLWIHSRSGQPLVSLLPENRLFAVERMPGTQNPFLVGSLSRDGKEFAVRGLGPEAETVWTVLVSPQMENPSGDFCLVRSKEKASQRSYVMASTTAGKLREIDDKGRVLWDGLLVFSNVPEFVSSLSVQAMASADLNSDGTDEVYVIAKERLIRLDRNRSRRKE